MGLSAIIFGATGRLGNLMSDSLDTLGIPSVKITREVISNFLKTRTPPSFPTSKVILIDASVDYESIANLQRHEVEKQVLIDAISRNTKIELVASFSSGATDFDDKLITNIFYKEYKKIKQENLFFYQSLGTRIFYPKIYTLIGKHSLTRKSTGWVDVFEQAKILHQISIAYPYEPRSWVSENAVHRIFVEFVRGDQTEYLATPVCGTFQLLDIVSFFEKQRGISLHIRSSNANTWLSVPYVASNPTAIFHSDINSEFELLIDIAN